MDETFDPFRRKINKDLLPFEEALRTVMSHKLDFGAEKVHISDSDGRVLREDIFADRDFPPFDKSVVDGFACRLQDLDRPLKVVGEVRAGERPSRSVGEGECVRVMTGAPVPPGADVVVMVEETVPVGEDEIRFVGDYESLAREVNIYRRGSDVKAGELLIPAGTRLFPQHIAVLASVGKSEVLVSERPRVGIVVTGDEVVEPEVIPGQTQIRNTNAYSLYAQLKRVGAEPIYYGIASDDVDSLLKLIARSVEENPVTLVCGGVSMGDYDLVPEVMRRLGFDILFDRLAIKPGRPTTFAVSGDGRKVIFGLSGNPVSGFVAFEILVKLFLFASMGHRYEPMRVVAPMGVDFERGRARRDERIPVKFGEDGAVYPVEYHGSAHFQALIDADGFITIPRGVKRIPQGKRMEVWMIRHN